MRLKRGLAGTFCLLLFLALVSCSSQHQGTLRIATQHGIVYLPILAAHELGFFEAHASRIGAAPPEIEIIQVGGASAAIDAILSDSVQISSGGIAPLIKVWAASYGNKDVMGIMPIVQTPMFLNTNNPNIVTLSDFSIEDRIAVPAVRSSIQAVILQYAAQKEFGISEVNKFDPLTVSMKHPDAMANMLSGISEPRSHFTVIPFAIQQLQDPAIRTITTSYEIIGGPHSQVGVWVTKNWAEENPLLYKAVYFALLDAIKWINENPKDAADLYVEVTGSKIEKETLVSLLSDPSVLFFTPTPAGIDLIGDFLFEIGDISMKPQTWDKLFLDKPASSNKMH